MMVAIPELDGATGRWSSAGSAAARGLHRLLALHLRSAVTPASATTCISAPSAADMLAARVGRLVDLRRSERAKRKVALVIFNFPPNAGNTGTAAFLSVFESLHNTLARCSARATRSTCPPASTPCAKRIINGNAETLRRQRQRARPHRHRRPCRRERWLKEIEAQWGPAPGKQQSDGSSIFVLGERFGNVFVGMQPGLGYEGDPMRLLFEKGFAPTHAFSAFYRWLREDFGAHAVLHFGTHGALEFMPGKQNGMSGSCWPDRLIGDLPNFYLYASNNPSEGTIAKRRAAAT
jgi:magnesium chelatase subunit H